jgi:Fic family protein
MFSPTIPNNQLPHLPGSFDYDAVHLLKLSIQAHQAIARIDGLSLLLPNYELLISPLLAKESIASNAIENINTTMVDFLQQEAIAKASIT